EPRGRLRQDSYRGPGPQLPQALDAHLEHRDVAQVEHGVAAGLHEQPRAAAVRSWHPPAGHGPHPVELAAHANPGLTARPRRARMAERERAEHRVLPGLVPPGVEAHAAARLRPAVAG